MKQEKIIFLGLFGLSIFTHAQVGINTTSPTATMDINGTARVRDLTDTGTYTRSVVADGDGNLGYVARVTKPTPADITLTGVSVSAPPQTIATGVTLSEFAPIITRFTATSGTPTTGLPTYVFSESGGNLVFDMIHPISTQQYNISITFVRKN